MAKNAKNGLEKQAIILSQFERIVRNEKYRTEPTLVESIIAESAKKRAEWEKKKPTPSPRISFYNPNNPLNGFNTKSKDEQKAILKSLKEQEKAAKLLTTSTENC
jgi:hypothetical protein